MNKDLSSLVVEIVALIRANKYDEIKDLIFKAVEENAINIDSIFKIGIGCAQNNRLDDALLIFHCLQSLLKNDARIPYNIGLIHALRGEYVQALEAYDGALKINPADVDTLINKGSICNEIKNYSLALEALDSATELRSDIPEAWSNKGIALNNLNFYSESINAYNQALILNPNFHEALSNKSVPLNRLRRFNEAAEACDRALNLKPDYAEAYANKGDALSGLKRYEEALDCYDNALSLKSDYAEVFSSKGVILHVLRRYEEALKDYDRALNLKPDYAEAYANKGDALSGLKRYEEALDCYDRALNLKPDYAEAWTCKGASLHALGRYEDALGCYDQALSLQQYEASYFYQKSLTNIALNQLPSAIENLEMAIKYGYSREGHAEYLLSALKPENGLKPMPKDFVAELFDGYAGNFDKHLVDTLKYQTPVILFKLLNLSVDSRLEVLDLGCGTGLMGSLLKPYALKIVGIDLSKEMLSRAELTGAYDQLVTEDVTNFLNKSNEKFDLVLAADVFIYIGELSDVFNGASRIIKEGGQFCFSVEKANLGQLSLSPKTLRFSHSKQYIENLASANNFKIQDFRDAPIRKENNIDVDGYAFLLKKI